MRYLLFLLSLCAVAKNAHKFDFKPIQIQQTVQAGVYNTVNLSSCPAGVRGDSLGPAIKVLAVGNNGSGNARITTPAAMIRNGQKVVVSGISGAVGAFSLLRISSTQYDVIGSAYTDGYMGGGYIQKQIYSLWIDDASPEMVFVSGGTCKGDKKPGTLQFYASNTHTSFKISSATSGVMEALYAYEPGTHARKVVATVGPSGRISLRGPVWLTSGYALDFSGIGMFSSLLRRDPFYGGDLIVVDGDGGASVLTTIHDLWLYNPTWGDAGSANIRYQNVSCCEPSMSNVKMWNGRNGVIAESVDGLTMSNVNYFQLTNEVQPEYGLKMAYTPGFNMNPNLKCSNCQFSVLEPFVQSVNNGLIAGLYVEGADGSNFVNCTFRGQYGVYIAAKNTMSGVLISNSTIDRSYAASVAIAANGPFSVGQVVVKGSWLTGTYAPDGNGVIVNTTLSPSKTNRITFSDNDIAGHTGSCVRLIGAKDILMHDNYLTSCNLSKKYAAAVSIEGATTETLDFHHNRLMDTSILGPSTYRGFYFGSSMRDVSIKSNKLGAFLESSYYSEGMPSTRFYVENDTQDPAYSAPAAPVMTWPPSLPAVMQITGTAAVNTLRGGWNGASVKVQCSSPTTLGPPGFSAVYPCVTGTVRTFTQREDGKWYGAP